MYFQIQIFQIQARSWPQNPYVGFFIIIFLCFSPTTPLYLLLAVLVLMEILVLKLLGNSVPQHVWKRKVMIAPSAVEPSEPPQTVVQPRTCPT